MYIEKRTPKVGDKIRINADIETTGGTFKKGHIFEIIGIGERGYNLSDGKYNLLETNFIHHKFDLIG